MRDTHLLHHGWAVRDRRDAESGVRTGERLPYHRDAETCRGQGHRAPRAVGEIRLDLDDGTGRPERATECRKSAAGHAGGVRSQVLHGGRAPCRTTAPDGERITPQSPTKVAFRGSTRGVAITVDVRLV